MEDQAEEAANSEVALDLRTLTLGVATRIVDALSRPCEVADVVHDISVSIGINFVAPALSPDLRSDTVMQAADAAIYTAKHHGKNQFAIASPG